VIWLGYLRLVTDDRLRVVQDGEVWQLSGPAVAGFGLINEFLGHLADRNYSPRTRRSYAFDLLGFARWLDGEGIELAGVDVDVLLRFLTACRERCCPGVWAGTCTDPRCATAGYAPRRSTVGWRRSRRCSRSGRCVTRRAQPGAARPGGANDVTRRARRSARACCQAQGSVAAAAAGAAATAPWADPGGVAALLGSFRTWRDRAIAGLMLLSGLRSAEVLGLLATDVDIARRWVRVIGKGEKERRVPIDVDVAGAIQTYLLAERPQTDTTALFVVAKGAHRGRALSAAGLRTVFRYHRARAARPGRASPRAAALVRHRTGRGRGGPVGDPGADGPRPRRFLGRLHPPRPLPAA
jgi:hypothetical protein